jgi:hypothetical protein
MSKQVSLDVVPIRSPCTQPWEAVDGNGSVKFCAHCQRDVHDLSCMTTSQVEQLLAEKRNGLCVQYETDHGGTIKTLDYEAAREPSINLLLCGVDRWQFLSIQFPNN